MENIAWFIFGVVIIASWIAFQVALTKYRNTPLALAISESSDNLRQVEQCALETENVLKYATTHLESKANIFVSNQQDARLNAVPIESLKAVGAVNIRWSALRQAGYTNLAKIVVSSEGRLMTIPGVGKTTAMRVMHAARSIASNIRDEPPTLPLPNLLEPGAEELAHATLHLLHAKELLEDIPDQIRSDMAKIKPRIKKKHR